MLVVIDTTALVADFRLNSTQVRLLLELLPSIGGSLAISEVSVQEASTVFGEHLRVAMDKRNSADRTVTKLLGKVEPVPAQDVAIETEVRNYEEFLRAFLKKASINVLPLADVTLSDILQRDLLRQKPFGGPSGYRDYLIWRSVLRGLRMASDEVVFITNNLRDFAQGDTLHPELEADVERQFSAHKVTLVPTIKDFNDRYLLPVAQRADALRAQLANAGASGIDLYQWVRDHLQRLLEEDDLLFYGVGLPPTHGSARSPRLVGAPSLAVEEAYQVGAGKWLVKLTATVPVKFDLSFTWSDYENSEEVREFVGWSDEPFTWISWDQTATFELSLELILGGTPLSVESYELTEVMSDQV